MMDGSRAVPRVGPQSRADLADEAVIRQSVVAEVGDLAAIEERYGHYSLTMKWDPDDRIYVVTVPELPGCRTHGATMVEAAAKARYAIATWIEAALHWGEEIPPPVEERHGEEVSRDKVVIADQ